MTGWYSILPVFVGVAVALLAAAAATRWPAFTVRDALIAVAALGAWAIVALNASNPAGAGFDRAYVGWLSGCFMALALGALVASLAHRRRSAHA